MQSEYPLSVLMVVPPWPGAVEQNPEPTTPTGPPSPAAAAAATLSRYQGYISLPGLGVIFPEFHSHFSQKKKIKNFIFATYFPKKFKKFNFFTSSTLNFFFYCPFFFI